MPKWFSIIVVVFGVAFFAFHLLLAVTVFRRAESREYQLEAIGELIPGTAGVFLVAAVFIPSPFVSVPLALLVLPILIFRRMIYDEIIFRNRQE